MVKLLSISNEKALQRGQGLRRSVGSLVALQAGCQRNAGSTANLLKQTTGGRKVKSAKFVAKFVLFVKFYLLQSCPVILQHTGLKMEATKKAL